MTFEEDTARTLGAIEARLTSIEERLKWNKTALLSMAGAVIVAIGAILSHFV